MNQTGFVFATVEQGSFVAQLFWDIGFIGLLLVVVQAVLTLVFGHHGDLNSDGEGFSWSNFLSLKTMAAMCLGIGFGSAALGENGFSLIVAMAGGAIIGLVIAAFFFALMRGFHQLRSDGTTQLKEAIGQRAKVYLSIPGEEAAAGEIQVGFGGRFVNVPAFTRGPLLPNGTDVLVTSMHGDHALEVEKVSTEELKIT